MTIEVVKVGGGSLASPGFPARLSAWLDAERAARPSWERVLVVGGGAAVDALREIDRVSPLDPEVAHWEAIERMVSNARLVASWLPSVAWADCYERLPSGDPAVLLFDVRRFLREIEPRLPGPKLRASWDVTSDSIAARLAGCLDARLTLLKPPGFLRHSVPDQAPLKATWAPWDSRLQRLVDKDFERHAAKVAAIRFTTVE
ncbi:hypothetical protein [Pseudobythopirellula maris]|uniref:hypothetical protein n=1 Tax=Pseudobythopirellula maris TaxID=2527991 RepID=UPI0011B7BE21|nr:hypothetical protein [Pseudobythopirellula maris]